MLTVTSIDGVVKCVPIASESKLAVVCRALLQALDCDCGKIAGVCGVVSDNCGPSRLQAYMGQACTTAFPLPATAKGPSKLRKSR